MTDAAASTPQAHGEALRRIRAAETEWEQKVQTARQTAEAERRKLADELDRAVHSATVDGEAERARRVAAAREAAEAEATRIDAEGRAEAGTLAQTKRALTPAQREAVLAAVLGDLRA